MSGSKPDHPGRGGDVTRSRYCPRLCGRTDIQDRFHVAPMRNRAFFAGARQDDDAVCLTPGKVLCRSQFAFVDRGSEAGRCRNRRVRPRSRLVGKISGCLRFDRSARRASEAIWGRCPASMGRPHLGIPRRHMRDFLERGAWVDMHDAN
jgi:hypothetical protein